MELPKQKLNKEYIHDYFKSRVLLFLSVGYSESRSIIYISYIVFMFIFHFYLQAMSIYASYLVIPRRVLIIDAMHAFLISWFAIWGLSSRLIADKRLQRTRTMIENGIYLYEEEELDENQEKMMSVVHSEVKRKSGIFVTIFSSGWLSNMIFFPLSQVVMYKDNEDEEIRDLVNPYFPHFFYSPFDQWTWWGFTLNYFFNGLLFHYVYGTSSCMNEIYISCTVQLKAHLQVLNYSIQNIEKRAYDRYIRLHGNSQLTSDKLLEQKEYQNCLYQCLKANVKHHIALVKFKNEFMPYTGACLLDVIILATIIYAAILYLIYQRLPVNYVINFVITLLCEQTYSFYICMFGQEIIDESSTIYDSLYGIRWMEFDKNFNVALDIMMCNTMKPMILKALIISSAACLETYADILSAVYKLMNLVKHSDDINRI